MSDDAVETAPAPEAKRPKTKTHFDPAKHVVTIHEPGADPVHYDLSSVPEATKTQLLGKGAAAYLANAQDGHAKAFERLAKGEYSARMLAPPKELSPWRLAIAHAAVEDTKRSETPLTLDQAKVKAAALDADAVRARKVHPLVVKHYNKLAPMPAGATPSALL